VLFVSHNMNMIKLICGKTIYLSNGLCEIFENTSLSIEKYKSQISKPKFKPTYGNENLFEQKVAIIDISFINSKGRADILEFAMDEGFDIQIDIKKMIEKPIYINMAFYRTDNTLSFVSISCDTIQVPNMQSGIFRYTCSIPSNLLNQGVYEIRMIIIDENAQHLFEFNEKIVLEILEIEKRRINYYNDWLGCVRPKLNWTEFKIGENIT